MAVDQIVAQPADVARGDNASLFHDGEAARGAACEADVLLDEQHSKVLHPV